MSISLSRRWVLHAVLLSWILQFTCAYKYFTEPKGRDLHHYDARYFRGKISAAKRADALGELIVAFLDIAESEGMVAWLAHGTLMGWYWNGHSLPWDWDVDMQIDVTTLQTFAEEYNSTVWTAVPSNAGPDAETRDYLLDVNPYWMERVHGDGANFIDARFIDTRNGLYIDITALTELDPENLPNVVSCKNYHNYQLSDIYPLRETIFEGTRAKVPHNYKTILAGEYGDRSLVLATYNGHVWNKEKSEWLPKSRSKPPYRIVGVPTTPSTRIIPDEELPYFDNPAPLPDLITTAQVPNPPSKPPSHSGGPSIEIEELPADRIDAVGSDGSLVSLIWEYLTLFWRK